MKSFWLPALVIAAAVTYPVAAMADQSSEPGSPAAGRISAGGQHSCALPSAGAWCWGFNADRQLGYRTTDTIGDDETPGSAGPIDFGAGLTAQAISAGLGHTCALLGDATLRCWGLGGNGRLGYASTNSSPAGQTPGEAAAVDVGGPVRQISAGEYHTCAILVDGTVRCWGYGGGGILGYAGLFGYSRPDPNGLEDPVDIGDTEVPASAGAVDLGTGRTATAISAGGTQTCAILDDGNVRCWGDGAQGATGSGSTARIGDDELPGSVPPVYLGAGRTATAIEAGNSHTCALLDDQSVRCWGQGLYGQLGTGTTDSVGDDEKPGDRPTAVLGGPVKAISAGGAHTCALMVGGAVRCWGRNQFGQLGIASTDSLGDDELPTSVPPVDLGPGRTAVAVAAGETHTCALLDDGSVRCWGWGNAGRLGYCNQSTVGDNELPSAAGPVDLGTSGAGCPVQPPPVLGGGGTAPAPDQPVAQPGATAPTAPTASVQVDARVAEATRRRNLRTCLRRAARRPKRSRSAARRTCLRRYGRTPGRVTRARARATGRTRVVLTFRAPGSDGRRAPAARNYLVRQSLRPMRTPREFARGQALCRGSCHFSSAAVGATMTLTITNLRPRTTYYYSVAARDNVSNRRGPRSATVRVRTR